jgi:two-component system LytT family sensor kinase
VVLKLSALMRYMVNDCKEEKISLEKEVQSMASYIELEKIRFDRRLEISFNVHNDIKGPVITPLILLPFIENSFKHGPSGDTEKAWITIDLMVRAGILFFKVENSKALVYADTADGSSSNGFGLKNVERRLALLYPGKYSLEKKNDPEYYAIDLKLDLSKN